MEWAGGVCIAAGVPEAVVAAYDYLADITLACGHTHKPRLPLPSPLSPLPSPCSLRGHDQVLEIEIIKQAGIETYTRTFELPVGKAYKMYDSIMRGLCEKSK